MATALNLPAFGEPGTSWTSKNNANVSAVAATADAAMTTATAVQEFLEGQTGGGGGTPGGGGSGVPQEVFLGKTVATSVPLSDSEPGHPAYLITDGDGVATRFISLPTSPIDITVDLGAVFTLSEVTITFAGNTIRDYTLKTSIDGVSYTTVFVGQTNNVQLEVRTFIDAAGTADSFSTIAKGRYFRVSSSSRWNSTFGNSIYEIAGQGVVDTSYPVGALANFTATVLSNTSVRLDWDTYSGSALTSYTLTQDGSTITAPSTSVHTITISGLGVGSTHTWALKGNYTAGGSTPPVSVTKTTTGGTVIHDWLSGTSGVGSGSGGFGTWRGSPLEIATHWVTLQSDAQVGPGQEYGTWDKDMIFMVGLMDPKLGQSWASAAAGAYVGQYRTWLTSTKARWQRIQRGTPFIGVDFEFNATWMPWSVSNADKSNAKKTHELFRSAQLELWPEALCGVVPVGRTNSQQFDWRQALPTTAPSGAPALWASGRGAQDFIGVNWYAMVYATTSLSTGVVVDAFGGPVGLESHRANAQALGVPIIVPEWGVSNTGLGYGTGDDAGYIQAMHDFFVLNGALLPSNWATAGTSAIAGKVLAETYFNVSDADYPNSDFQIYPPETTTKPLASARYALLW